MTDERGYTLVELLVGMFVSLIVLGAIFTIVQVATRHQDRVAEHVAANQRARPAMTRIVDRLHSACVAPGLAPVLAGSTDSSMILLSKAGAAVSPTPDKYVISLAGGVLSEAVYAGGGSPPKWTFPGFPSTPTATVRLVDGVTQAAVGDPPALVPVFRYYAYQGGQVAPTPLQTPLDADRAARTVQVDIAFTTSPSSNPAADSGAIVLTDSATLRIEPASEDSAEVNLPCV